MSGSKRPLSARQLAANRANAARSTGPRTAEGKARSARGAPWAARRHGFAAAGFAVVRLEDLQAVAHLKADLVAVYQPVNARELFAIERIALAQQALLRASRLESGLFATCLNEALDSSGNPIVPMSQEMVGDLEVTRAQNRNFALAEGFRRMAREGNAWTLFLRYQAQAERQYRRAVEELERLKVLRRELPNEAIFDNQPAEKPTNLAAPETNPTESGYAAPPVRRPVIERHTPGGSRAPDPSDAPCDTAAVGVNCRPPLPAGSALEVSPVLGPSTASGNLVPESA